MHGVKADYKHLSTQRTQLYGNLWYSKEEVVYAPRWEQFVVKDSENYIQQKNNKLSKLQNLFKTTINRFKAKDPNISDLENELSDKIGLRTEIQFSENGSSGSLKLYYSDLSQLDDIMKRLKR